MAPAAARWIVPLSRPFKPRRLCFCLPHAGGAASAYARWAGLMPPDVALWGIQLPGRETRIAEPAVAPVRELTAALAEAVGPELDRPAVLFGHSMGALLAFELARELRRLKAPAPVGLFVSGFRAPHLPPHRAPLHVLSDQALVSALGEIDAGTAAALVDRELRALFLPILRHDLHLCETYRYHPEQPLAVPITAMGGVFDPQVREVDLAAWRAHTGSSFKISLFGGGHFYLREHAADVVRLICSSLWTSRGRGDSRERRA